VGSTSCKLARDNKKGPSIDVDAREKTNALECVLQLVKNSWRDDLSDCQDSNLDQGKRWRDAVKRLNSPDRPHKQICRVARETKTVAWCTAYVFNTWTEKDRYPHHFSNKGKQVPSELDTLSAHAKCISFTTGVVLKYMSHATRMTHELRVQHSL
jgi:hypothetical protein